jgi:pyruvate dehydrogenase E2 component (dihydrolipoamide acetyltransferase)
MAEVIRMPRMSDTMTEGVIVSWLKKPGDKVKSGDILAEVETDKATMELESYTDGTLLHIGAKEGDAVPVEGIIAVLGKEGEDYKQVLEQESKNTPKAAPEEDKKETPKTEKEEPTKQEIKEPAQQEKPVALTEIKENGAQEEAEAEGGDRIKASPLAKKIAEEKGVSLNDIKGSGDQGRIVKRDIENYTPQAAKLTTGVSINQGQEGFEDKKVSQMRKAIARRLTESKFGAPHFYLTMDIDMGRAMEARKAMNTYLGSKVSFNDIIIKAAAAALKHHPKVNASWMGDHIRYYRHVHIGVAIAVEDGLVVPVLKFADQKPISALSQEVKAFSEKAGNKKLQPADFEGNTFTISNLGMFGIDEFTAIINPPDACILAVGAIKEQAIVKNGQVAIGNMMKVTLSCDHRVVDGATGAQFLQTLKQFLEEPVTILA